MTTRVIFPAFRDQFEATRYPFADTATLASTAGRTLDPDLFLDAALQPLGASGTVFLAGIEIDPTAITLALGDNLTKTLATSRFNPLDPPDVLAFDDQYSRPAGILVSESSRLARLKIWPTGVYVFTRAATEFAAACVFPLPGEGLRGLLTDRRRILMGDVWLVGENGVVLRQDADGVIRVDIVGDPLFARRLCSDTDVFTTPEFLRTINECGGDQYGNYQLAVGTGLAGKPILRVVPSPAGILIEAIGSLQ